jgi:hypothetical protein
MSFSTQNDLDRNGGAIDAEETLRLIASLPAPQGIEDRVKSGVRAADRQSGVMMWPESSLNKARWTRVSAMRVAAAAAIVLVVAGGGWEVYSHIHLAPEPAAVAVPQRVDGSGGGSGGLSAAAARRTPKTLDGPVVATPGNSKQTPGKGSSVVLPQVHSGLQPAPKSSTALPAQQ